MSEYGDLGEQGDGSHAGDPAGLSNGEKRIDAIFLNNVSQGFVYSVESQEPSQFNVYGSPGYLDVPSLYTPGPAVHPQELQISSNSSMALDTSRSTDKAEPAQTTGSCPDIGLIEKSLQHQLDQDDSLLPIIRKNGIRTHDSTAVPTVLAKSCFVCDRVNSNSTQYVGASSSGNGIVPNAPSAVGGRVSSLLQKASGKSVVISDAAREKSAQFMSHSSGDGAATASATMSGASAAACGSVSSLLQKASGKSVVISDAAREKSAQFMAHSSSGGDGAAAAATMSGASAGGGRVSSLMQKASGKSVVISDAAREKSSLVFQCGAGSENPPGCLNEQREENVLESNGAPPEHVWSVIPEATPLRAADSTVLTLKCASGKSVVVSEEARVRSELVMAQPIIQDALSLIGPSGGALCPPLPHFTPRAAATNLPPRFIAERMLALSASSSNVTGMTSLARPELSSAVHPARSEGDLSAFNNTFTTTARKTVHFREDVMSVDRDSRTPGGTGHWTPQLSRINGGSEDEAAPLCSDSKPLNPARVLFDTVDEPESPDGEAVPLRLATPLIDRTSLLRFDPLHDWNDSPLAVPMQPRALFSSQSERKSGTKAGRTLSLDYIQNQDRGQECPPDFGDGADGVDLSSCDGSTFPMKATTVAHERRKFLNRVNSQNVVSLLRFDSAGDLLLPSENGAVENNVFPPLLLSLFEEFSISEKSFSSSAPATLAESRKWLDMQYRWVLWTLAAHERRHANLYWGKLLTEKTVREALRWRWKVYSSANAVGASAGSSAAKMKAVANNDALDGSVGPASKRRRTMYSMVTPSASSTRSSASSAEPASSSAISSFRSAESLTVDTSDSSVAPITPTAPRRDVGNNTQQLASRTASKHFERRGSMSPLQRCADIACLVWPLVVCFAGTVPPPLSAGNTVASSASKTGKSGADISRQGGSLQVTDGWWWTSVQLDADLFQLFQKVCSCIDKNIWSIFFHKSILLSFFTG